MIITVNNIRPEIKENKQFVVLNVLFEGLFKVKRFAGHK